MPSYVVKIELMHRADRNQWRHYVELMDSIFALRLENIAAYSAAA